MHDIKVFAVYYILKILTVLILFQLFIHCQNIILGDPAVEKGYLLKAGYLSVLMAFNGLYKIP